MLLSLVSRCRRNKCLGRRSYANVFEMMCSSMTKGENGYGDSLIQRRIQMLQVLPDFVHFPSNLCPATCPVAVIYS